MNIADLILWAGRYLDSDPIFTYPARMEDDGEIMVDHVGELKPVLQMSDWKGEAVLFYEEKPMFVAILMSDESLCRTVVRGTREAAVGAGVEFVKEYSTLVDLQDTAREYLVIDGAFSFAEGGFDYTIHVGKTA